MLSANLQAKPLFSYRKYWADCFAPAPFLPMSKQEMQQLGWDSCDIIIVVGDAYVDHPSFGMAIIGRLLEAQGFRVGIIAQPDWSSAEPFKTLGKPNLFFGVSAGNMDSMINRYTADLKLRHDDAYSPHGEGGKRPDRAVLVYANRCREAYKDVPIIVGGIEASLRRIAHYDYWSDKVRQSCLLDAKADMLVFGNAERAIVEIAHRIAAGETIDTIQDIRGSAFVRKSMPAGWLEIDSTQVDQPGRIDQIPSPYQENSRQGDAGPDCKTTSTVQVIDLRQQKQHKAQAHRDIDNSYVRLPAFERVSTDPVRYAHASRVFHLETNPGNARALVQRHGNREVWLNPPPLPLSTAEMDAVFELPYARLPHPSYGDANIPAYEMIRFSVNIMRGCFGGCSFCSITEHEGRIIQNRSESSILREITTIRDKTPGFTGTISDLGGPTANMWQLACKDEKIEKQCRRLSCVFPTICKNLNTDQSPLIELYRKARDIDGVKRVLIASGLRYDLAVRTPAYVKELVTHHVGGYLKIAPEHTESGPLAKMMKPGMDSYYEFKRLFDKYSAQAGKEQYLIPYFIAAHPGTSDEDMMKLALWLKHNGFRADQVQTFYPSPLANATTMFHTSRNPLRRVTRKSELLTIPKGLKQRRLHKAFLRYHDPKNWPLLRDALQKLGRADLIGNGKQHLVPRANSRTEARHHKNSDTQKFATKHTHSWRGGKKKSTRQTSRPKQRQS